MSILLEALRKSEKSKRAHEVPTIHAEEEFETAPESMATGPLALLLVSALFMSGWFIWHQYQEPASDARIAQAGAEELPDAGEAVVGNESPVPDTPEPSIASQPVAANKQIPTVGRQPPPSGESDSSVPVKAPVPEKLKTAQLNAPKPTGEKSTPTQRTPVESYKPPVRSTPPTQAASSESGTTTRPVANTTDGRDDKPASALADATSEPMVEAARPKPKPKPEEPLPIGYWELPDSVRANVPEIKFSVLVYATRPSDRFVLINGERLTEGDNAGSNLVVKEIRREGVIFSHGLYQFLVEK